MRKTITAVGTAALFALGAPSALAATIHVSTTGTDAAGCGTGANPACATIQGALDTSPAASGDTIQVAAGSYSESATLTVDKNVTISGAGVGTTTLTAPFPTDFIQDPAGHYALVFLGSAGSGSTIQGLTVDGNGNGIAGEPHGGNQPFVGIDVLDANATLQQIRVTRVEDTRPGGGPGGSPNSGDAIRDINNDGVSRTLTIDHATIDNYNKTGMDFRANNLGGLTVNVTNTTVTGFGPTTLLAQNGIAYLFGAMGSVTGTTVSGNECDVAGACGPDQFTDSQAAGIEAFNSGPVTFSQDSVHDNDIGIFYGYPDSGNATISGNTMTNDRFEGILLNQGTANVTGSTISGSNIGVQVVSFDQPSDPPDPGNAIANLTGNTIINNTTGISLDDDNPTPTVFPVLTAHNNVISQNTSSGIANNVPEPQNATYNYWGCSGGPFTVGCDGPTGSGAAMVSYIPFLTSPAAVQLVNLIASVAALPSSTAKTVLSVQLGDALAAAQAGNTGRVCLDLAGVVRTARQEQSYGQLTAAQATSIINSANQIAAGVGCGGVGPDSIHLRPAANPAVKHSAHKRHHGRRIRSNR